MRTIFGAIACAALMHGGVTLAQTTTRVSVSSSGQEANGPTTSVAISETGRWVAFQSGASNLVSGDTNGVDDIFLHDRNNATTTRLSVPFGGGEADGACSFPSISGDGGWIAFESTATNLVPGPGYGPISQIYVHDRASGLTMAASSAAGNGPSSECAISLDGKWVVFQSGASNLVPGDTNGTTDIFLAEVGVGTTTRLSVLPNGVGGNGPSTKPSLSADGRYVAFVSSATNLVAGDTNGMEDVFLCDTTTGVITRVSLDSAGVEGNGASTHGAISPDGGYVAFASDASNLVLLDGNGARDIFVRVLATGQTTRASVSSSGTQSNGNSFFPSVSWWGDVVAFHSLATNLMPGVDPNGSRDVFAYDLTTGVTKLISSDLGGGWGNGTSWLPRLSPGGRVVAFPSLASNLVAGDTNGTWDAFVHVEKKTWYVDVAAPPTGSGTPSDPFYSIQYALDQPYVVGGDTLLVAAGTYNETIDLRGKPVELRSSFGSSATIIDPIAAEPAITVKTGKSRQTVIDGFAILGNSSTGWNGSGLNVEDSWLALRNCAVSDHNTNSKGGGIYAKNSIVEVNDCVFSRNGAWFGGCMYFEDVTGYMRDTVIKDNCNSSIGLAAR